MVGIKWGDVGGALFCLIYLFRFVLYFSETWHEASRALQT